MKAIMIMFDSLNRHLLPPYGCDWVHAPNFARLARRTASFEQSWVCSLPCMPARRDLHTGRPNFLHSNWSPLQPWDDSVPEILKNAGISTHIVTDHYHYLEDGGTGYLQRYSTWEAFRGQEGDPWKGQVRPPEVPPNINVDAEARRPMARQDWINRQFFREEADFPQSRTFAAGLDFLERNHAEENWFLQIETFDPHEPFHSAEGYQAHYPRAGESPVFDWPSYGKCDESPEEIERIRHNYAALLSQCDANLGRVLDAMDRHNLWEDTLLIVWTDHGFLLGEHNRWAKVVPALWQEISHTPFFIWDPRHPQTAGSRRSALVQPSIDLGPTLLRYFGQEPTRDMLGHDLAPVLADDTAVRKGAIFGYFGMPLHYTDGRYVYVRDVVNPGQVYHIYASTPALMRDRLPLAQWQGVEFSPPLPFTKGTPVLRRPYPTDDPNRFAPWLSVPFMDRHLMFDLEADPGQRSPVEDPALERKLVDGMLHLLREAQAPAEMLCRYGLS